MVAVSLNQWLLQLIFDSSAGTESERASGCMDAGISNQVLSAGKEWSERVSAPTIRPWSSTEWILIVKIITSRVLRLFIISVFSRLKCACCECLGKETIN